MTASLSRQERRYLERKGLAVRAVTWREMPRDQIAINVDPRAAAQQLGVSVDAAVAMIEQQHEECRFFMSGCGQFEAQLQEANVPGYLHLTIRRRDGKADVPWAVKQAAKDQLVGEDHEAMELFPAKARLVDIGNSYHLWVKEEADDRFTEGWDEDDLGR